MDKKPVFIAGPCVIESAELLDRVAARLVEINRVLGTEIIFKASFDKANRTSLSSYRGVGLEKGLQMLSDIRSKWGLRLLTDIHESSQAASVGEVVDVIQIPAFLCRQTDLLLAAARTGRIVNVKKAQFLSGEDMRYPYEKAVRIPTKLSVSQVVKEGPGHRFLRRPSFLRHDELTPAQKGNAIHKFMQFADFKAASRSPEEEIARLVERQFISPQEAQWVSPQKVSSFFESGIGKRMLASPRLLREYRFLGEVSAEIAGGEPGEEPISIQGVMDCLFFEGEEMVIVDYKTDRVKGPEELVAR